MPACAISIRGLNGRDTRDTRVPHYPSKQTGWPVASAADTCQLPTFAVHSMTIIRKKVLSDHASNGNPTYCSDNDAWACSEACR